MNWKETSCLFWTRKGLSALQLGFRSLGCDFRDPARRPVRIAKLPRAERRLVIGLKATSCLLRTASCDSSRPALRETCRTASNR